MNRNLLIGLCLATVLIGWGVSWEMLRFQTGNAGLPFATVAVFYRFALAGALFAGFVIGRDLLRGHISFHWPLSTWALVALLGAGFFSTNFSLYYYGSIGLPPGLVSLFFASIILVNLVMTSVFMGYRPSLITIGAALTGVVGIVFVLWPSIFANGQFSADWATLRGAGICFMGTVVVSCATMVQLQLNARKVPVVSSAAFGMLFGAAYTGMFSYVQGHSFDVSAAPSSFFAGVVFLAIFSSIGAFSAYLKLVGLVGPNRGAYVNLATAAVALAISYFVGSSGAWIPVQFFGVGLILIGYYCVLRFGGRDA